MPRYSRDVHDEVIEEKLKNIERSQYILDKYFREEISELRQVVSDGLKQKVNLDQFLPVKQVVYWFITAVGAIGVSVITYFLTRGR